MVHKKVKFHIACGGALVPYPLSAVPISSVICFLPLVYVIREIFRMGSLHVCFCDDPEVILTGRGQVLMAKKRSDMSNGTAVGKEDGSHGMPKHMRVHPLAHPSTLSITAKAFHVPWACSRIGDSPWVTKSAGWSWCRICRYCCTQISVASVK